MIPFPQTGRYGPRFVDITNQKFGHLTALAVHARRGNGRTVLWRCGCDNCGNEDAIACGYELRSGRKTHCGCIRYGLVDIGGRQFGKWTVLFEVEPGRHRRALWFCECECGTKRVLLGSALRLSQTRSCGCLRRQKHLKRITKHGHARRGKVTKVYRCWRDMLRRCRDPRHDRYLDYGGRGISVCDRWIFGEDGKSGFECFLADMGEPLAGQSIDRINNDGDYTPTNCKWSNAREQIANRRPSKKRKARRAKLTDLNAYAAALARASSSAEGRS
jgi:hypothetical protein